MSRAIQSFQKDEDIEMKTTIHTYRFNLKNSDDAKAYKVLRAKLESSKVDQHHASGGIKHTSPEQKEAKRLEERLGHPIQIVDLLDPKRDCSPKEET